MGAVQWLLLEENPNRVLNKIVQKNFKFSFFND